MAPMLIAIPLREKCHEQCSRITHFSRELLQDGSDLVLGEDEVVDKVVIVKLMIITLSFFALVMLYQYFSTRPPKPKPYVFPRKKPKSHTAIGDSTDPRTHSSTMIERIGSFTCVRRSYQPHDNRDGAEDDEKKLIDDPLKISLRRKPTWCNRLSFLQRRHGMIFPTPSTSPTKCSVMRPKRPQLKPLKLTLHAAQHSVTEKCKRLVGCRDPDSSFLRLSVATSRASQARSSRDSGVWDSDVDEQLWDKKERNSFYGSDSSTMDEKSGTYLELPAEPVQVHLPARVRFASPLIDSKEVPEALVNPSGVAADPWAPPTPTSLYGRPNDEDLVGAWGPPPRSPKGTYGRASVVRASVNPGSPDVEEGFRPKWGMQYKKKCLPKRSGGDIQPPGVFTIGDDDSEVESIPKSTQKPNSTV